MGRAPRRRTGRRPETYDLQLVRLLHRIGMEPRKTLLRTRAADDSLVQTLRSEFIESDESFEAAIIDLLEESLDFLKTWEVTDGVADVFVRIQGKVEWTKNIKVNVIMELYHNVVVSRLNSKRLELQNPDFESTEACQLAVAVDLLMEEMNGIDDFLHEVKCYLDLVPATNKTSKRGREWEEEDQQQEARLINGIWTDASVGINKRQCRQPAPKPAPEPDSEPEPKRPAHPPRGEIIIPEIQWPVSGPNPHSIPRNEVVVPKFL